MSRHLADITDLSAGELRQSPCTWRSESTCPARWRVWEWRSSSRSRRTALASRWRWRSSSSAATRCTPAEEVGFDVRESAEDITHVMAGYHGMLAARAQPSHSIVTRMAAVSPVPVVNMLSDHSHPLQALADVLTMQQVHGAVVGLPVVRGRLQQRLALLAEALALLGGSLALGCPLGYHADDAELER